MMVMLYVYQKKIKAMIKVPRSFPFPALLFPSRPVFTKQIPDLPFSGKEKSLFQDFFTVNSCYFLKIPFPIPLA